MRIVFSILFLIHLLNVQANADIRLSIHKQKIHLKFSGKPRLTFDLDESYATAIKNALLNHSPGNRTVLFYVHCYLGQTLFYQEYAESVVSNDINDGKLIIHVEWGSVNPFYGANKKLAERKGKILGKIFQEMGDSFNIHIIAHSMGTELMRNAMLNVNGVKFKNLCFASPDLSAALFAQQKDTLLATFERLHILTTNNDIILKISNNLNHNLRIRAKDSYLIHPTIYVTNLDDVCHFGTDHLKWLTCKKARLIISGALEDIDASKE